MYSLTRTKTCKSLLSSLGGQKTGGFDFLGECVTT